MEARRTKITLLISTYNWKESLKCSLTSAFRQTLLPMEIIIADDGSKEDTRELIEEMRQISPVPLIHVWHEDRGFRKCEILNKAIAKAQGDYIVQIDGDIVMEQHFIEDHANMMEKWYIICGSRVLLTKEITDKILTGIIKKPNVFSLPLGYALNGFRISPLRKYLAKRYAKDIGHLRGCNMAFWKEDIIAINGYNEDLTQWGHEDTELGFRLYHKGLQKKVLKMGGIAYHLYHKPSDRSNEQFHWDTLNTVRKERSFWTKNGIDKLLLTSVFCQIL